MVAEGTDIAALSANDTSFDLLVGESDGSGGRLESIFAGIPLERDRQNSPGLVFGLEFGIFQDPAA
jgi:hypothetical protein